MNKLPEFKRFFAENAEQRRYDYPELTTYSWVIDIGAYKGEFAEKIINKYNCKVIGYEPIKSFFDDIQNKNIPNYTIYNYGVSDKNEDVEIVLQGDATSSNLSFTKESTVELCKHIDILNIIDEIPNDIDLLKINIEGGEFKLLECLVDNPKYLKKIKNIQVQFHNFIPDCEKRRDDIIKKLTKTHEQTWSYHFVWENWRLK